MRVHKKPITSIIKRVVKQKKCLEDDVRNRKFRIDINISYSLKSTDDEEELFLNNDDMQIFLDADIRESAILETQDSIIGMQKAIFAHVINSL